MLQGVLRPELHLKFKNTSLTVLQREFFESMNAVRNISVDVRDNELEGLENPSTGGQPGLPKRTFLNELKLSRNKWACNCDLG